MNEGINLFTTKRCNIRRFKPQDLDRFMAYRNDPDWMRFQGFKGLSREEYQDVLLSPISWDKGAQLAVVTKEDRLIGDLYVRQSRLDIEIGFTISPAFVRQGYAEEAVSALVTWLKGRFDLPIIAETDPENTAAIGLLRKLRFSDDGIKDGWRRFVYQL